MIHSHYLRHFVVYVGVGTSGGGVYSPSLDYSDARNSFYRAMGW